MSFRRMLPFILINIVVSAVVVLAILFWWDGRKAEQVQAVEATAVAQATNAPAVEVVTQPTETAEPDGGPLVHVVQAGETLGRISEFYDIPLEDIMAANGLDNPNVLSVGQELTIPVGGIATATPESTATAVPDVLPSPNPTEPAVEEGEFDINIEDVVGLEELTEEAVQIINSGSRQAGLLDWTLSDADGHVYTFGPVTLFGDGAGILVHTEAGPDDAINLFWGLEEAIWQSGEQATLKDADGNIQSTFIVP